MKSRIWRSETLVSLTFLFTGLALLQLGLAQNNLRWGLFFPWLALVCCGGATTYILQKQSLSRGRSAGDPLLIPLIFLLSGLGLALTSRLAPAFITRQAIWLIVATAMFLIVAWLPPDLNWLRHYKYAWMSGGLLLLATTLVVGVNPSGFGARLWLQLGGFFFQPSEPLKLFLIVFLAAYLADRRRQLVEIQAYLGPVPFPHPSYFGPMLIMWGLSIILLVWQRDLGAALLFFGTFLGMLYAATGQRRYIWVGGLLLIGAGGIGYSLFDVVQLRVESFWNPWVDAAGRSFQIVQSLLAFANGGFFGQGLGQGLPTAIPVVHTDFVYAAIGEEYGLVGALAILVCFGLLVSRAFFISLRAKRGFEQLLALGIGVMLGLQTLVITAGTLKLMPLTGVTLPFVSYGGSSLVTSFVMVGLLLFVSRQPVDSPSLPDEQPPRSYNLRPYLRLSQGFFVGFCIVAGGLIFWQIGLASFLIARADNPRPIIAEQIIRRGRLLTADGIPVAETVMNEDGLAERRYPYPGLAAITGYYSLRYGVGGTEATFDHYLRGTQGQTERDLWWNNLLHLTPPGQDLTITIDLPAQVAADVALADREGAVVVMDIETGAILVMSSHPTYDPNQLDETWDSLRDDETAPLLNRATQGLFPVGDLARLIGLIGLYEAQATIPADPTTAPLEEMLAPLGETGYLATAYQLGFTRSLPNIRSQPGLLPDFADKGTVRDLAITPLHLARVVAALELDGQLIDPVVALDTTPPSSAPAIRLETSRYVRGLLAEVDEGLIGLAGVATPKETGQQSLSWFVGLAPTLPTSTILTDRPAPPPLIFDPNQIDTTPPDFSRPAKVETPARYVVVTVVVIEDPTEIEVARQVAAAPIRAILEQTEE